MKKWVTSIMAVPVTSNTDGKPIYFAGPMVEGETIQEAQAYCEANGLGYCKVIGEFIEEIDAPEWDAIDFIGPVRGITT
jgi:hypothetical protein